MWSVQTQNQGFDAPDKIRAGVSMNDLRRKEIRRALAGRNISAARLDWNGESTSQSQRNCRWQEQKSFHLVTRGPSIPGHHRSSNF